MLFDYYMCIALASTVLVIYTKFSRFHQRMMNIELGVK